MIPFAFVLIAEAGPSRDRIEVRCVFFDRTDLVVCFTELDELCDCSLLVVCCAEVSLKGCLERIEVHPRGSSTCKCDCVGSRPVCCTVCELIENGGPHDHRLKARDRDTQGGVVDSGLGHKAKAILS